MKVTTGIISNGTIILDTPPSLPNQTRVRVVIETMGPTFDEAKGVTQTPEEVELVRRARKRLGKITRRECD